MSSQPQVTQYALPQRPGRGFEYGNKSVSDHGHGGAPRQSVDAYEEDYVVVSPNPTVDATPFRPSLGDSFVDSDGGHSNQSHDPLIQTQGNYNSYNLPPDVLRPLATENKLNPTDRAALIRQTRKIHKILGEVPQIADVQALPTRTSSKRLQRRPTLAGSDIKLDRSAAKAAMESPKLEPPPDSSWGKMASSLVATGSAPGVSNAPVLKLNVVTTPEGTTLAKRARRLSDSSVASSLLSLPRRSGSSNRIVKPDGSSAQEEGDYARRASKDTKHPKSAIYIPPSPTSPSGSSSSLQRQQTRARMAKLQQIMGEAVPSELVIKTQPASSVTRRRRLSMESPSEPMPAKVQALKHKRSRSMWKRDLREGSGFDSAPESLATNGQSDKGHSKSKSRDMPPIEELLYKQLQVPTSDKQRALNVKRALKMAAVFGVPPPQAAYQDRQSLLLKPTSSIDSQASRQSLASLAYMLDHDRDSLYDLLSHAADSGSESDDEPLQWPYERKGQQPPPQTTTVEDGDGEIGSTKLTVAGRYPDMAPPSPLFQSTTPTRSSSLPAKDPTTSQKPSGSRPPPLTIVSTSVTTFSNEDGMVQVPERIRSPAALKTPGSADQQFSARRRRANKLSKFFGVGYQDLFNTMVYGTASLDTQSSTDASPPVPQLPASAETRMPSNRSNLLVPGSSSHGGQAGATCRGGTVLVETDAGRSTVLRTSTNLAADVDAEDMSEVMTKLRSLKA
ncbi:SubName: Full=Uncharacterized protein {ECO:0000313/EMBL:CCA68941.1} [Serendipita indica DSM 11827]|nr:SubName: Full=Uncharacterized protein {ECO:0000313/EMBL:CCA68941.1} [Serendipita indica DSM 11827]